MGLFGVCLVGLLAVCLVDLLRVCLANSCDWWTCLMRMVFDVCLTGLGACRVCWFDVCLMGLCAGFVQRHRHERRREGDTGRVPGRHGSHRGNQPQGQKVTLP